MKGGISYPLVLTLACPLQTTVTGNYTNWENKPRDFGWKNDLSKHHSPLVQYPIFTFQRWPDFLLRLLITSCSPSRAPRLLGQYLLPGPSLTRGPGGGSLLPSLSAAERPPSDTSMDSRSSRWEKIQSTARSRTLLCRAQGPG